MLFALALFKRKFNNFPPVIIEQYNERFSLQIYQQTFQKH
jgi:hypothetical protein